MEKWTKSLFATKRSVGWAVDGTNNVSWGDIFPKTTRAMLVLPERREPIKTILGARSARSLSPSLGVAGHRSRLAYIAATARGWPLYGAAGLSAQGVARRRRPVAAWFEWWCPRCPRCGAATAREAPAVENRQWTAKGVSTLRTAAQVRLRRQLWLSCLFASVLQDASCAFAKNA